MRKHFTSIVLIMLMIISILPIDSYAYNSMPSEQELSSQEDIYDKLRGNKLISGKDYIENEIVVCCETHNSEVGVMTEVLNEYNLSLDYCLSSDSTLEDDTTLYLMSINDDFGNVLDIINDLQKEDDILFAQPNYIYSYETETSNVTFVN
ncbi:MAG: hypothetical protein II931_01520, partial [Clostridia bacterium]|nr:hypothetical protein [Clostridia bacterium]